MGGRAASQHAGDAGASESTRSADPTSRSHPLDVLAGDHRDHDEISLMLTVRSPDGLNRCGAVEARNLAPEVTGLGQATLDLECVRELHLADLDQGQPISTKGSRSRPRAADLDHVLRRGSSISEGSSKRNRAARQFSRALGPHRRRRAALCRPRGRPPQAA